MTAQCTRDRVAPACPFALPRLRIEGRLEAPLASFETGFGQRFNTAREHVARVEVRATDASGKPVALDWDEKAGEPLNREPPTANRKP